MRVVIRSEGKHIASFVAKTSRGLNKKQKAAIKKLRELPKGFGLWPATMQYNWLKGRGLELLIHPVGVENF